MVSIEINHFLYKLTNKIQFKVKFQKIFGGYFFCTLGTNGLKGKCDTFEDGSMYVKFIGKYKRGKCDTIDDIGQQHFSSFK